MRRVLPSSELTCVYLSAASLSCGSASQVMFYAMPHIYDVRQSLGPEGVLRLIARLIAAAGEQGQRHHARKGKG